MRKHTRKGDIKSDGKFARASESPQPPISCPDCGSHLVWKDGLRHLKNGETIQRFLCRTCGHRFSEPKVKLNVSGQRRERSKSVNDLAHDVISNFDPSLEEPVDDFSFLGREDIRSHESTVIGQTLYAFRDYKSTRRVCDSERESKNLASKQETRKEWAAGATADVKGKIVEFLWYLKKQGYAASTIETRANLLKRLIKNGVNLFEAEQVKELLALHEDWSVNYKNTFIEAYSSFLEFIGGSWEPPKYRPDRSQLPFIPLEKEIDALVAGSSKKVAASLQVLKETGMRIGEVWGVKWTDLDQEKKTLRCNRPLKHSNSRMFKVSEKLISMLNSLPKRNDYIFGRTHLKTHRTAFVRQRRKLAKKLNNPRLETIHFHTLRHWKGTMEYHKTKDILHVKNLLGHKMIECTLVYTQLAKFEEADQFHVRTASDPAEIKDLLEVGFEYVCKKEGLMFFRRRK